LDRTTYFIDSLIQAIGDFRGMIGTAIETIITLISNSHDFLPTLDSGQTFVLNGLALLSVGLFVSKPVISTKGDVPRDKDKNEILPTNKAVIVLMIAIVFLFGAYQLIDVLYQAAILSGYQAAGIFIISSTQYIISSTDRNHTTLTKILLLIGSFLILGEIV
jgi:hypothetical protein